MIQYPNCVLHSDCPYQYLILKKQYPNLRLACSNCIYQKEILEIKNSDLIPINMVFLDIIQLLKDPNQLILNASIDGELLHYYQNFAQICQDDLREVKTWKNKLADAKQAIQAFIDDIDLQINQVLSYQDQLKNLEKEFLNNLRLEEFFNLLNKMAEEQKENNKNDTSIQLQLFLESIIGYDSKFIGDNIHQLRNKHAQLRICLKETKSVKLLHEINTIVKRFSDNLSVMFSKFNSPCITDVKPSSNIVSAEYFKQLLQEISSKSKKEIRFEHLLHHGKFTNQTFWENIEGKSNTLLIFKSRNSIFGGYTPCQWDGQGAKSDEELISYLFSYNSKKFYHLKKESKNSAIVCDKRFGPIFGSFYFDLMIKNDQNGSSYLGHCYGDDGYKGLPSTVLFGGQQPYIIEFELFEIIF